MRWLAIAILMAATLNVESFAQVEKSNTAATQSVKKRSGPKRSSQDTRADETARNGLASLRSLINQTNFKQFGLDSFAQVSKMDLGEPVPVYYVRADQLKDYKPGTDAGRLMISANRRLYPVVIDGVGKLLITIEKTENGWRMVGFGQEDIAPALTKIKRHKVERTAVGPGASEADYFAVQIPSMHLNFLAYSPAPGPGGSEETKRQVMLTPLASTSQLAKSLGFKNSQYLTLNPSFNADKEGTRKANEVFKTLAKNADAAMKVDAPQ